MNEEEDVMPADAVKSAVDGTENEDGTKAEATNSWLENVYDNFSGVPLKYLDAFIMICMIALVAVVLVGVLKAKGML